ncbi:DUF1904 family protein [Paenibacillus sp. GCM10023248]|uniref:DUF1904 family protein n=1 Tax=Bacillales TaxID=1385 RepID=UPI0023792C6B|nr:MULTISPECIES: DUF1904 family protein [Bacillales]MDD9266076.1 DUF1904 family protein [Paenibacillus sp. MAHUQ-63]MDR6879226.1 hypothetical protein [Bacillus sp. 3255]
MPRLTFRGITVEQLCAISESLVDRLAVVCSCDRDNFTLECIQHAAVFGGKQVEAYPFVEVAWFERGDEVRDGVAGAITDHVLGLGIPEVEVAFTTYAKEAYYSNGTSFK